MWFDIREAFKDWSDVSWKGGWMREFSMLND